MSLTRWDWLQMVFVMVAIWWCTFSDSEGVRALNAVVVAITAYLLGARQ